MYVLLFADTGLSVAEISSLFVIWSVTGLVLEVPSGVWADAVSRRMLLCIGPLLSAIGFALWTLTPSYWAFAVGFVLWGAHGALQSGATEALIYAELDRCDAAPRYATIMGRAEAVGVCAVMAATAVAGPVFSAGGYLAVGAASVLARLLCAAVATRFPEHRPADPPEGTDESDETDGATGSGYADILRSGLREVRSRPSVLRALLLVPAVAAVWGALEEYDPLLAESTGVAAGTVPLLVLLIAVGVAVGGLLVPIGQRLTGPGLGRTLAVGALALAIGAISGRPAGFVLLAAAFCVFNMAGVVADARLQERITGPSRATVTSLAGLATDLATIAIYGAYAAAATFAGHGTIFALFAVPYLVVAAVLMYGGRRKPTT